MDLKTRKENQDRFGLQFQDNSISWAEYIIYVQQGKRCSVMLFLSLLKCRIFTTNSLFISRIERMSYLFLIKTKYKENEKNNISWPYGLFPRLKPQGTTKNG